MRSKIVIGNWKMNKSKQETELFFDVFNSKSLVLRPNLIYGIAVPSINIPAAAASKTGKLVLASQDISSHEAGAYTGEIAPKMLKSYDVTYAVIGHSERRQYHHETNAIVNAKAHNAIKNDITPIICVGETLAEYEQSQSKQVVQKQTIESIKGLDYDKIVIAYEPVWAIGTGETATTEYAQSMCAFIRTLTGPNTLIQYGGSVSAKNVNELLSQADIDGALVGGAALEPDSFMELIRKY